MRYQGLRGYFSDFYNKLDSLGFVLYCLYFILRISNQHLLLPETHIEDDCPIGIFSFMVMLNLLLIVQGFIKMMFFLRVSEKFGKLVQLVG